MPVLLAAGLRVIATHLDWVDVTAQGISKARTLELVRVTFGVEANHTAAIDDGENDLTMLSWAAYGSAMAQAPAVVAAAGHRTGGYRRGRRRERSSVVVGLTGIPVWAAQLIQTRGRPRRSQPSRTGQRTST
jgi:hypothetical protein